MSKGSSAQPQSVDPNALAAAQTASNISTATNQAALNNANVFSPYGTSVWTPSTNAQGQTTYTLNQNLSPQLQALFQGQTGLAGALAGYGQNAATAGYNLGSTGQTLIGNALSQAGNVPGTLNLSNVAPFASLSPANFQTGVNAGPIQTSLGSMGPVAGTIAPSGTIQTGVNSNFPGLVQQAQTAAYNAQTQYLDPQWSQAQSNLQQQLADQGIQEGTQAFSRAMLDFNNQKQQAYSNAGYNAVQAGNQQEQALFGQSLQAGQFANAAQQQQFGQNLSGAELQNAAQQQLYGQALGSGQFANAAQAQQFGQGLNLAQLYNQALLSATNQNNLGSQFGLQLAQAPASYALQALQGLTNAGTSIYGQGLGSLGQAAGLTNLGTTWPLSVPTMGGQQTTISPTGMAGLTSAATGQNQLAYSSLINNLNSLGTLGGQALFGGSGGLGSVFGGGGALGSLGGWLGAQGAASSLGLSGLPEEVGTAAEFLAPAGL